jgi:ABC-2 type transport system permease protein
LAPLIGITIHFSFVPELIFFMILLSLAIAGLGLLIASLMKTMESFGLLMQLLVFPLFFLSGAFFPLTTVPSWMALLAKINPLTYGVDAIRQIILKPQTPSQVLNRITLFPIYVNLSFLLIFSIVMLLAAVFAFNKKI